MDLSSGQVPATIDRQEDLVDHEVAALGRPRSRTWSILRRDPMFWVGASLGSLAVAVAVLAPVLAPYDPIEQFRGDALRTGNFPLGTDRSGRDELSRLIYGARTSLLIGIVANGIALAIGVFVGATAATAGRPRIRIPGLRGRAMTIPVESLLMRLTDLGLAFPVLLLAIAAASVFRPSLGLVVAVIASVAWTTVARIVYGRVLVVGRQDFIEAARAQGVRPRRILWRHVMPHVWPLVVVYGSLGIAGVVLFEATLSYLGAGVPPPTPTWGTMIADGLGYYASDPRLVLLPGAAIMLTVLGFNLLGDALRDALDPRSRA